MKKVVGVERLVRTERFVTMSVYEENCTHRISGPVDPPRACFKESLTIILDMFEDLQNRGVNPGTKLKIIIETAKK